MAGLNVAFHTGESSLLAREKQMAVIGQNIANADRIGYHRQVATTSPNCPLALFGGQLGTGVHIERVMRVFDQSLESNLLQATHQDGYAQSYSDRLGLLEDTIAPQGEPDLQSAVMDFANAWQMLATEPESFANRSAVVQRGSELAERINRVYQRVEDIQAGIVSTGGPLETKVEQINTIAGEIAYLNKLVRDFERRRFQPQQANDLRDRRDELMGELSRIADVHATEQADGTYTVQLAGRDLVVGDQVQAAVEIASSPALSLVWSDTSAVIVQDAGEIQGLLDASVYVQDTLTNLENFAQTVGSSLNALHSAGFDMVGNAGAPLLDVSTPGQVVFLITNPAELAASADAQAVGDGTNAMALWQAMNSPIPSLSDRSIIAYADAEVDRIAIDREAAEIHAESTQAGIAMFQQAISDISGVNTDQELLAMLEIERAYQATARFVRIVDELIAETINLV
jgi:flagellar hook-associated protein 1 FlgK